MRIGVVRETLPGETRVALVPPGIARLSGQGHEVLVETGAGERAMAPDAAYCDVGARVVDRSQVLAAELVLGVHLVGGCALAAGLGPVPENPGQLLMLERLPRVTRAQPMDVLSSQAAVAGYKAVLLGAAASPRIFPMLTTAAGTIRPSKVLVLGAGVAGLMAIATAHRLGAVVFGYDVRPEAGEQVRSLGATYVGAQVQAAGEGGYARPLTEAETAAEQARLAELLPDIDVMLTCAQVPGGRAPVLISAAMASRLRRGAVVVDLAADRGGNCALTRPGETWVEAGVTYLGPLNVPALVPVDASAMFSRNMEALVGHLAGITEPLEEDELLSQTLVAAAVRP